MLIINNSSKFHQNANIAFKQKVGGSGQDLLKGVDDSNCNIALNKKIKEQIIFTPSTNTKESTTSVSHSSEIVPFSSLDKNELAAFSCLENQMSKDQVDITSKQNQTVHFENRTNITLTGSDTDVQSKRKDTSLFHQSSKHRVIQQSTPCSPLIHSPNRTRFISQTTKQKVFQRARGVCEFIGVNGKRCNSKYQLEWDHVVPWSQGGGNDENSLRVYCRTHNQYRTKETHGFWYRSFKK